MPLKVTLICFSILIGSIGHAQQKITFKPQYQPKTTYGQKIEQSSVTEIIYTGLDENMQNKMAQNGQPPMKTNMQSTIEAKIKTGELSGNAWFPVSMEITGSNNSYGNNGLTVGTIFYGRCMENELPFFDSIFSETLDTAFKHNLLKTIQASQQQFTPGAKAISIGDTMMQDSKLNIPMAGASIAMNISTVYTLSDIKNGIATFDLAQVFTMDSIPAFKAPMANGSGSGKMLYDISNKFLLSYTNHSALEMKMQMDTVALILKTSADFIQTYTLLSN